MPPGRYLFVSDLHLDGSAPQALQAFLSFLEGEARASQGLFILGDLFESWIGDDDADPARQQVCAALKSLTEAGIACRVQHGNRDFLLGAGFVRRTGCELLPDPHVIQVGRRRVVLSHGDALCTRDVAYQRFRRVVRTPLVQRGWLSLPLAARRGLAASLRRRSRRHTRKLPQDIMDVTPAAVTQLLRRCAADLLVHGHTHRPGVHHLDVDGRACARIVLGDWYEQGSVLELRGDGGHDLRVISWRTQSARDQGRE
ncbi:MAG: UDP-2,3-diacylglucosamine diphosphatase [Pseudomonadota bacterium]|jgi:UDP-2,3-diacylglucosamine hydrolase|nr:MAG: UDP-2,3-diacylglucosamine diphosphatase [Pseudomonadota bacterium]